MQAYYQVTEKLKDALRGLENITTVSLGDISEVDLNKRTIFPLAHIVVTNCDLQQRVSVFDLSILFTDVVDYNTSETKAQAEPFYGNNNLQDVHNTQRANANLIAQSVRRGDLFSDRVQIIGDVVAEPFQDRFENTLAGWALSLSVAIPDDTSIC